MIRVEVDGLENVVRKLSRLERVAPEQVEKTVEPALKKIRTDARTGARKIGGRAKGLASAIDYSINKGSAATGGVEGTVGFKKGRRKGGIPLEVGTRHTAPKPVLRQALEKNREDFFKAVDKAVEESLK